MLRCGGSLSLPTSSKVRQVPAKRLEPHELPRSPTLMRLTYDTPIR